MNNVHLMNFVDKAAVVVESETPLSRQFQADRAMSTTFGLVVPPCPI